MAVERNQRCERDSVVEHVPDSSTFDDATASQPLVCSQSERQRGCLPVSSWGHRVLLGVSVFAFLAVVVLCVLHTRQPLRAHLEKHPAEQKQEIMMLGVSDSAPSGDGQCPRITEETDFSGNNIDEIPGVTSADGCCQRCTSNSNCVAWAWGGARDQYFSDVCYLKGPPLSALQRVERSGYITGESPKHGIDSASVTARPLQGPLPVPAKNGIVAALIGLFGPLFKSDTASMEPTTSQPPATTSFLTTKRPSWEVCPLLEDGTDYPGNDLKIIEDIISHEACCDECSKEPDCVAYSWGRGRNVESSDKCFLKGTKPRTYLTKVKNDDMTSGTVRDSSIQLIQRPLGTLLYCFALMVPGTNEKDLIQFQYDKGTSMFDCDDYSVYSSEVVEVVPNVKTIKVDTSLQCEKGGEFGTALNKDIFMAVWAKVLSLGKWSHYDWTVKVDPDAPFFPTRLRYIVAVHPEGPGGVYLNNCDRGLHGPIEVFSKGAVGAWEAGRDHCNSYFSQVCGGDCQWGEDMFIDQCLSKVLNVRRDFEPNLLVEDHCDPPPDWRSCTNKAMASYHPFKTVGEYEACYNVQPPESI